MTRTAPWLPVAILVLLVALSFWLERMISGDEARRAVAGSDEPDVIVEDFTARKMGPDGALRYTLNAKKMTHFAEQDIARLEAVSFEAAAPDQPRITATSSSGTVSGGGDQVVLEGNVVVTAAATPKTPAWSLSTPRLTLVPDSSIVKSDDGVKFASRDMSMLAASFVLNTESRVIDLKQIRATYQRPQ